MAKAPCSRLAPCPRQPGPPRPLWSLPPLPLADLGLPPWTPLRCGCREGPSPGPLPCPGENCISVEIGGLSWGGSARAPPRATDPAGSGASVAAGTEAGCWPCLSREAAFAAPPPLPGGRGIVAGLRIPPSPPRTALTGSGAPATSASLTRRGDPRARLLPESPLRPSALSPTPRGRVGRERQTSPSAHQGGIPHGIPRGRVSLDLETKIEAQ